MHTGNTSLVGVGRTVVREVREREVTFMAAAISYYAFVSLVPLLVLVAVVAVVVGGEGLQAEIGTLATRLLLPAGQEYVRAALQDRAGQGGVGLASLVVTTWGALKMFRGVDTAFGRIYGVEGGGLVDQVRDGLLALGSIGVGVLGVTAVGVGIALLNVPFLGVVGPVLLLATLLAAFFPFYYVFPGVEVTVREVVPGTVFAAGGWTLLGSFFGVYAAIAGEGAGALGTILLLVTYFYFAGTVLLVGAVVNAVLGGRLADGTGTDRQLQHPPGRQYAPKDMTGDREDRTGGEGDRGRDRTRDGDRDRDRDVAPRGAPDIADLAERVDELRADLDAFETDVDERTVERPKLEAELKRYVRRRMRRGKARGWGPYLVLLYGTVMTLGAFYFLNGVWAILAMVVLFLSTLGLFTLFVLVGLGLNLLSVPGRAADAVRDRRG